MMNANTNDQLNNQRKCLLCHRFFTPHPKVKQQQVCSEYQCQRLRQKMNQIDWLERNPVNYKQWYQDYGKEYRKKYPNYQRLYRQTKKKELSNFPGQSKSYSQLLKPLLHAYQSEKKEELTFVKLNKNAIKLNEKKEQLTDCFILLKVKKLSFLPLSFKKKEDLTYCFHNT